MFRTIKRFVTLWKQVSSELKSETSPATVITTTQESVTAQNTSGNLAASPAPSPKSSSLVTNPNGHLALPLRSILVKLTPDCMRLVRQLDVGDALVFLSTPQILEQIPKGAVKIPFSELKKASPPGVFSADNVLDKVLVELPLQEIIARLDHSLLARRVSQQHVYLPNEITAPFAGEEKGAVAVSAPVSSPEAQIQQAIVAPVIREKTSSTTSFTRTVAKPDLTFAAQPSNPVVANALPAAKPTPSTAFLKAAGTPANAMAKSTAGSDTSLANAPAGYQNSFNTSMIRRVGTPLDQKKTSDLLDPQPDIFSRATPDSTPGETDIKASAPPSPGTSSIKKNEISSDVITPLSQSRMQMPEVVTPISPIAPQPLDEPAPIRFQFPKAATPEVPAVSLPVTPVVPIVPVSPIAPVADSGDSRTLNVSVQDLSVDWPEVIQQEIHLSQIGSAMVAFPFAMIQVAIKQGKVALPWRIIRSWVKASAALPASLNDSQVLELPLRVITPLFLAELKGGKTQRKIQIDESIPDLFSGGKTSDTTPPFAAAKPAPNALPVSVPLPRALPNPAFNPAAAGSTPVNSGAPITNRVADTNYFSKPQSDEINKSVTSDGIRPPSIGTTFLNRYATPNEIVSKAAALAGVTGALVALPDGLLVASEIPPTMNAHTIAAFLPQMFSRVSQCTKELRQGDLNNLSFTVGVVPWKIFKVGSIYFAAFGSEGVQMPTSQLAGIAAELDRNPR